MFDALNKIDNNILKLDTVDLDYIHRVDRPTGHYDLNRLIERMKDFKGNLIIQTMFMKGTTDEGVDVDNTSDQYVLPWLEVVKQITPKQVMIYTIDRETPDLSLRKATHEELDRIVNLIRQAGIQASAPIDGIRYKKIACTDGESFICTCYYYKERILIRVLLLLLQPLPVLH